MAARRGSRVGGSERLLPPRPFVGRWPFFCLVRSLQLPGGLRSCTSALALRFWPLSCSQRTLASSRRSRRAFCLLVPVLKYRLRWWRFAASSLGGPSPAQRIHAPLPHFRPELAPSRTYSGVAMGDGAVEPELLSGAAPRWRELVGRGTGRCGASARVSGGVGVRVAFLLYSPVVRGSCARLLLVHLVVRCLSGRSVLVLFSVGG